METCPVCNYSEKLSCIPLSQDELKHNRLKNLFSIHIRQTWWLTQPKEVCLRLSGLGVHPEYLLDIGCGDGRWVPGLMEVFPDLDYTGVDILQEHIEDNCDRMPDFKWCLGDFCKLEFSSIDTVLLAGTLNPRMEPESKQADMMAQIKKLKPKWIIVTFDYNSSGRPAYNYLMDDYSLPHSFSVGENQQSKNQNVLVEVYVRK